ncbi:unnamed protein product [Aphanomyces euteiches]|uniref:Uncharacterized protein n=1 Tax=Aphanomyces euteiches TaxID=100861 RepID=A0A6G0XX37_9STRA|nr:hypothetical protein Ae201684_000321 [Aphanomyces euteiches]KAH9139988.1 hypothetical protein AeRB84_015763 [Aphanomyces euteiches]
MAAVFEPELRHPVFQAMDITELLAALEGHEARIQMAFTQPKASFETFNSSLQDLFTTLHKLKALFRAFTSHRSLHIDNATFARWKSKLEEAHKAEHRHLNTIDHLEHEVLQQEQKYTQLVVDFEAKIAVAEARISTPLTRAELNECRLSWESERESIVFATAAKVEDLEQRVDDLQCQLHQTGDTLYQRERRLEWLEQQIEDDSRPEVKPSTPQPKAAIEVVTAKPAMISASVQVDLRPPPPPAAPRPPKPKSDATIDNEMILAELDMIRKLLDNDDFDCESSAWDQVRACGVLAAVISIKQRLFSRGGVGMSIRSSKFDNNSSISNNQVLSARQRSQEPSSSLVSPSCGPHVTSKHSSKSKPFAERPPQAMLPAVKKSAVRKLSRHPSPRQAEVIPNQPATSRLDELLSSRSEQPRSSVRHHSTSPFQAPGRNGCRLTHSMF